MSHRERFVDSADLAHTGGIHLNKNVVEGNRDKKANITHQVVSDKIQQEGVKKDGFSKKYLRYLLESKGFEEAVTFYTEAEAADKAKSVEFKLVIVDYLKLALQQQRFTDFIDLMDHYLALYYDDVDLLLVLAEYHWLQGYPDEAARTYQMALTYVFSPLEQANIEGHLKKMIQRTDERLSQSGDLIELLSFYELLDSLSLRRSEDSLRQAELYVRVGGVDDARVILEDLVSHALLGQRAQEVLATFQLVDEPEGEEPATENISIVRKGNHYVIDVLLDRRVNVGLMIDTGASITTLSKSAFQSLAGKVDFQKVAVRLFNTAGGVTKGTVYRVDELSLGENHLQHIDIAVLDYQTSHGVLGLLGMNVLRYFHFQIDQDERVLKLRERKP